MKRGQTSILWFWYYSAFNVMSVCICRWGPAKEAWIRKVRTSLWWQRQDRRIWWYLVGPE